MSGFLCFLCKIDANAFMIVANERFATGKRRCRPDNVATDGEVRRLDDFGSVNLAVSCV